MDLDYSTVDLDKLRELPHYKLPATYSLRQDWASPSCPPGHPAYFTAVVCAGRGGYKSVLRRVPHRVIPFEGKNYVIAANYDEAHGQRMSVMEARLFSLWLPLALDHARTREWILFLYKINERSYYCKDYAKDMSSRTDTLIYPLPDWRLKEFEDDERWSEVYRAAAKAEVDAHNKMLKDHAKEYATPDTHLAVRRVREFYPEYAAELNLINSPPKIVEAAWWHTLAKQPTEEECDTRRPHRHRFHSSCDETPRDWCAFCGRVYGKPEPEDDEPIAPEDFILPEVVVERQYGVPKKRTFRKLQF